jgi:Spy/CpxP family protein refolding chaperone
MKNVLSPKAVLAIMFVLTGAGSAFAQNAPRPDFGPPPFEEGPQVKRPNLLRTLGLTPAQMQQVRRLNQARKPQMDAALIKLREAGRALDETIYADVLDEAAFRVRLNELHQAQAEVARLRFTGELNVRKILTNEQLGRFRQLRKRFASTRAERRLPRGVDVKNAIPRDQMRVP